MALEEASDTLPSFGGEIVVDGIGDVVLTCRLALGASAAAPSSRDVDLISTGPSMAGPAQE